jgi:hypothetical protein
MPYFCFEHIMCLPVNKYITVERQTIEDDTTIKGVMKGKEQ